MRVRRSAFSLIKGAFLVLSTMAFGDCDHDDIYCHIDGTPPACAGVLVATFKTDHFAQSLKDAYKSIVLGDESDRVTTMKCPIGTIQNATDQCNYGTTSANADMRRLKDSDITPDRQVVVGAIDWLPDVQYVDKLYKTGENLESAEARTYIVAESVAEATQPLEDSTPVLKYTMYRTYPRDPVAKPVGRGTISRCGKIHTGIVSAGFRSCPALIAAHAIEAAAPGIRFADIARAVRCTARLKDACAKERHSNLEMLRKRVPQEKLMALQTEFSILANEDSSIAAYWFSCASGCCVANP
ncbi:MAG: hypothetical protein JWL61_3321 [Gemmatimonadetes bacterium]|nr:hypothetical protein [Gemmatimonadota bacterium]